MIRAHGRGAARGLDRLRARWLELQRCRFGWLWIVLLALPLEAAPLLASDCCRGSLVTHSSDCPEHQGAAPQARSDGPSRSDEPSPSVPGACCSKGECACPSAMAFTMPLDVPIKPTPESRGGLQQTLPPLSMRPDALERPPKPISL